MQFKPAGRTARLAAASVFAVATAACSSDPASIAGPSTGDIAAAPSMISSPQNSVIGSGIWINSIAANNSGRANTEFWDNMSADEVSGPGCNAGYFARGTGFAADCNTWGAAPGTPGGYTQWYSKNDRDAAAFTFDEGTYQLRLDGSYAGGTSEVGIFYMKGMTRIFVPISAFGTKTVGSTFDITPATTEGNDWGFYIANNFNTQSPSCGTTLSGLPAFCSDATGSAIGTPTSPFQQWALFANMDRTKYLVGAEDNNLELLPNTQRRDSDYNDYMISITPIVQGGQGCTPGFWKNALDRNWATTNYTRTTLFNDVFDDVDGYASLTLEQALDLGGGGLNALIRHTTAALLNASSGGVNYQFTTQQVINQFNAAYPGLNGAYETLKNTFQGQNELGCSLNNGGGRN